MRHPQHGYDYSHAQADAYAEIWAKSEASSHASTETIETLAEAKIFAIGDR